MAQEIITHHGHKFILDTMDWHNKDDAARASEGLADIVRSWSAAQAAEYHDLLTKAGEGDVEWDHPKLDALERQCSAVALEIFKGYASEPQTGHNCTISAE